MNKKQLLDKIAGLKRQRDDINIKLQQAVTKQLTIKILINSIYG